MSLISVLRKNLSALHLNLKTTETFYQLLYGRKLSACMENIFSPVTWRSATSLHSLLFCLSRILVPPELQGVSGIWTEVNGSMLRGSGVGASIVEFLANLFSFSFLERKWWQSPHECNLQSNKCVRTGRGTSDRFCSFEFSANHNNLLRFNLR